MYDIWSSRLPNVSYLLKFEIFIFSWDSENFYSKPYHSPASTLCIEYLGFWAPHRTNRASPRQDLAPTSPSASPAFFPPRQVSILRALEHWSSKYLGSQSLSQNVLSKKANLQKCFRVKKHIQSNRHI